MWTLLIIEENLIFSLNKCTPKILNELHSRKITQNVGTENLGMVFEKIDLTKIQLAVENQKITASFEL